MRKITCIFCGGELQSLPEPHPERAMVSDGSCLDVSLEKASCLGCGIVMHSRQLSADSIRSIYGNEYALAAASPVADQARARAYADALIRQVAPAQRILEVGCGSGALLQELHDRWQKAECVGLDPAVPPYVKDGQRISFKRGFFEAFSTTDARFDLVVSVNVIEHVADPADFFSRIAALLAPGGRLALFCPASTPPNLEILFHDHLHTFTAAALIRLANRAGLTARLHLEQVEGAGDFQFIAFDNNIAGGLTQHITDTGPIDLARERATYLRAWHGLDQMLQARTGPDSHVVMFGAGQMAALLRAYAPKIWARVDMLVVDNASDAWSFEKKIFNYVSVRDQMADAAVIIATAPSSQSFVAKRLAEDGLRVVCFNDVIPR